MASAQRPQSGLPLQHPQPPPPGTPAGGSRGAPTTLPSGLPKIIFPELSLGNDGICRLSCCRTPEELARDRDANKPGVYLVPPSFPGMAPTVAFGGSVQTYEGLGLQRLAKPTLFVRYEGVGNNAAKAAFKQAGFKRTDGENFNALWCSPLKSEEYRAIRKFQRVNHFPGTWELGRKDRLARSIGRMRRRHGAAFNIAPRTFLLPADADEWALEAQATRGQDVLYIMKPPASSRGRGIRLARGAAEVPTHKNLLVQQYIGRPHTIDGLKYDLRIYVCVTSFDPLRVYIYKEGLVRFATEKYSTDTRDFGRKKMHITNYSVNSKGEGFVHNTSAEDDGSGSKWSLTALRRRFRADGLDWEGCWADIKDVVVKAFLSVETAVNSQVKGNVLHNNRCFEIYGIDVLLDDALKPWLIEVNTGPNLASPAPIDRHIKYRMVANMMNLVGVEPYDSKRADADEAAARMARLTGLGGESSSGASSGGAGAASASRPPSAQGQGGVAGRHFEPTVNFSRLAIDDLPDVVKESESEFARCGEFERAFPSPDPAANDRYLSYFETRRINNILLCQWVRHCAGLLTPEVALRAPSVDAVRALVSAGGSRPSFTPPVVTSPIKPIPKDRRLRATSAAPGVSAAASASSSGGAAAAAGPDSHPLLGAAAAGGSFGGRRAAAQGAGSAEASRGRSADLQQPPPAVQAGLLRLAPALLSPPRTAGRASSGAEPPRRQNTPQRGGSGASPGPPARTSSAGGAGAGGLGGAAAAYPRQREPVYPHTFANPHPAHPPPAPGPSGLGVARFGLPPPVPGAYGAPPGLTQLPPGAPLVSSSGGAQQAAVPPGIYPQQPQGYPGGYPGVYGEYAQVQAGYAQSYPYPATFTGSAAPPTVGGFAVADARAAAGIGGAGSGAGVGGAQQQGPPRFSGGIGLQIKSMFKRSSSSSSSR